MHFGSCSRVLRGRASRKAQAPKSDGDSGQAHPGHHASRKSQPREIYNRPWHPVTGDFWLWAAIDADTKLVFSHRIGKRDWSNGSHFVGDVRQRVKGPVQIATDNNVAYVRHIREHFGYEGFSYGTEIKISASRKC